MAWSSCSSRSKWGHSKVKAEVYYGSARRRSRQPVSPCYVASDGPTVRIAEHKAFVPDALVAPLPEPALDSLEIPNPVIVVEVLSPSTARMDATTKLRGYFEVPSVQHYLIVDPEQPHHHAPQARVGRAAVEDAHRLARVRSRSSRRASKSRSTDIFGPAAHDGPHLPPRLRRRAVRRRRLAGAGHRRHRGARARARHERRHRLHGRRRAGRRGVADRLPSSASPWWRRPSRPSSSPSSTRASPTCSISPGSCGRRPWHAPRRGRPTPRTSKRVRAVPGGPRGDAWAIPKVMVFYLALLPSIIDLRHVTLRGLARRCRRSTLAVLAVVFGAYVALAARTRRLFTSPRAMRIGQSRHRRGDGLGRGGDRRQVRP